MSNFTVNTKVIVDAIRHYYPDTINQVEQNKWYNYISLFGVRIETCDTGKADDVIGCIWMNALGVWCSLICAASTDPSPGYINKPLADAAKLGGTAWVKEGQYAYFYSPNCKGFPGFRPINAVPVYRMPAGEGLDVSRATLSLSPDTLIHRSWGNVFKKDSAGCNILKNTQDLQNIVNMAKEHIKKYKLNTFMYTLLTRQQVEAVTNTPVITNQLDLYNYILNIGKYALR